MFARVTTIQGEPGRTPGPDLVERAVPALRNQSGFKGLYLLADRNTGENLAITLWETEQQAEALGQGPLVPLRDEGAREIGATAAPTSKVYEVITQA